MNANFAMFDTFAPLVPRIGWTLVHSMWEGVLVAALLLIVLRLLRAAPAQIRYVACCVALLAIVVSLAVTYAMLRPRDLAPPPSIAKPAPAVASVFAGAPRVEIAPPRSSVTREFDILRDVVIAWLIGVAVMSVRHVCGWFWLLNLRRGIRATEFTDIVDRLIDRMRIGQVIAIIEATKIDVPAVIGAIRPVIVIPVGVFSGLSPQQVEAILAHELAHIRRHDYLVNLIQAAVESLLFYHPAVWWISRRIRAERENCCDDIAAEICGNRATYAEALATLESHRDLALAPAASGGELLTRVRRILRLPANTRQNKIRSLAAAVLALACLALPLLVNAEAKPAEMTKTSAAHVTPKPQTTTKPTTQATVKAFDLGQHFKPNLVLPQGSLVDGVGIRDGVLVLTGTNTAHQPSPTPSTQPQPITRRIKLIMGRESIFYEGQRTHWGAIKKMLEGIPQSERKQTIIEVAAASPDLTVKSYNESKGYAGHLVDLYGLAYLSDTGIDPTPEPQLTDDERRRDLLQQIDELKEQREKVSRTTNEKKYLDAIDYRIAMLRSLLQAYEVRPNTPPSTKPASAPSSNAGISDDNLALLLRKREQVRETLDQMSSLGSQHPSRLRIQSMLDQIDRRIATLLDPPHIATADPMMREFMKTREAMEFRLKQLQRNLGGEARTVKDAKADLELQDERIKAYAEQYRRSGGLGESAPVMELSSSQPMTTEPSSDAVSRARALWRSAIDAEIKEDYANAVKYYEEINRLPAEVQPKGLDVRLDQARKLAK